MMRAAQIVLVNAARTYTPLLALFAFALLATSAPGAGIGFSAGVAFALALTLHALVFGAHAARAAAPPILSRVLLSLGVAACVCAAGAPALRWAAQAMEAGLFAATAGAGALIISAAFGRAPSLRDEDW
jgi:multisubunit Na+/H+ antiporter MnhB subunit